MSKYILVKGNVYNRHASRTFSQTRTTCRIHMDHMRQINLFLGPHIDLHPTLSSQQNILLHSFYFLSLLRSPPIDPLFLTPCHERHTAMDAAFKLPIAIPSLPPCWHASSPPPPAKPALRRWRSLTVRLWHYLFCKTPCFLLWLCFLFLAGCSFLICRFQLFISLVVEISFTSTKLWLVGSNIFSSW